jgi:hypothetical protein
MKKLLLSILMTHIIYAQIPDYSTQFERWPLEDIGTVFKELMSLSYAEEYGITDVQDILVTMPKQVKSFLRMYDVSAFERGLATKRWNRSSYNSIDKFYNYFLLRSYLNLIKVRYPERESEAIFRYGDLMTDRDYDMTYYNDFRSLTIKATEILDLYAEVLRNESVLTYQRVQGFFNDLAQGLAMPIVKKRPSDTSVYDYQVEGNIAGLINGTE